MSTPTPSEPKMKPIGLIGSLLYFGVPSAIFTLSLMVLLPALMRAGLDVALIFVFTFLGPLTALLAAAFIAYRLEGRPWRWSAFRDRMRLRAMSWRDWIWTVLLVAAVFGAQYALGFATQAMPTINLYYPPGEFTLFLSQLFGGSFGGHDLSGRWDVLIGVILAVVVLNVFGEELWWRGVILPRQEVAFGKWAWVVNGVLWNAFHVFQHSTLGHVIALVPSTMLLAFVAQRRRSTWPGIILHCFTNAAFPIFVAMQVIQP